MFIERNVADLAATDLAGEFDNVGALAYPKATQLLVTADAGGSLLQ